MEFVMNIVYTMFVTFAYGLVCWSFAMFMAWKSMDKTLSFSESMAVLEKGRKVLPLLVVGYFYALVQIWA
jgi:hypothetical protein